MSLAHTLLTHLADGEFHSGTALGEATARSRSAVWKGIQSLQETGVEIYSVRGKGYRLAQAIELLNREQILADLDDNVRTAVSAFDLQYEIDSTNAHLLECAKQGGASGQICMAETQRAGRGRRGRQWVSPPGGNLYLSVLWRFQSGAAALGGLSLAVAVAVMRALYEIGLQGAKLKWPNDVLFNGRKLAGILLELAGEASGPCSVVIGLGLNVRAPQEKMVSVDQPWTDLESALGKTVSRNTLATAILNQLLSALQQFEVRGLTPFVDDWARWDALAGNEVRLELPNGPVTGVARGIDENGALLLARDGELQRHHSGEVSVRLAATPAQGQAL